jgi:RNA-binding protein 25
MLHLGISLSRDRNELFAFTVDWSMVEARQVVDKTMRPWVSRKMIEYLGEEEESLTAFIVQKLNTRCRPQVRRLL